MTLAELKQEIDSILAAGVNPDMIVQLAINNGEYNEGALTSTHLRHDKIILHADGDE